MIQTKRVLIIHVQNIHTLQQLIWVRYEELVQHSRKPGVEISTDPQSSALLKWMASDDFHIRSSEKYKYTIASYIKPAGTSFLACTWVTDERMTQTGRNEK